MISVKPKDFDETAPSILDEDEQQEPKSKKEHQKKEKSEKKKQKEKEIEQKKAAKEFKKNQLEQLKKDKDEAYVLRKNTGLKVARVFIWIIISFILLKGIIASFRPDQSREVENMISDFRTELSEQKKADTELLSFAQNFVQEYMTYTEGEEDDYIKRISRYAAKTMTNNVQYKFKGSAKVTYAEAYRKEVYSPHQYDVWVLINVEYEKQSKDENDVVRQIDKYSETVTLKVPVNANENRYIIEDTPIFVADNVKISDFAPETYSGAECNDDGTKNAVTISVNNFFKAYYGEEQSVINYFLTADADKNDFICLNGAVDFVRIDSLRLHYLDEEYTRYMVIVTLVIADKNGVEMSQNCNLTVVYKDNQYYIENMDIRKANIKEMTEE